MKSLKKSYSFYKYQGAGNDFVLFDNRNLGINAADYVLFQKLCDRRFGIGADGVMLLQEKIGYDFEMLYYNADGKPSSMCGNGGRCIVAFAQFLGIIKSKTTFLASDGSHYAETSAEGTWINLQMIDVDKVEHDGNAFVLNTGSPHYVILKDSIDKLEVFNEGKKIRNSAKYIEKGINVNFVARKDDGYFVRTYERGVENETLACGTGATAVALAMALAERKNGKVTTPIKVLGGNLSICFEITEQKTFRNIYLEGPAIQVFAGTITI